MSLGIVAPAVRAVLETIDKHRKMKSDIGIGIRRLHDELRLIGKNIENHGDQEFQELAYDIEDFLPDIFVPGARHAILAALRLDHGTGQVGIIDYFLDNIKKLTELQMEKTSGSTSSSVASSVRHDTVLVGTAKSELQDLLSAEDGELRVVSIAGGNGLGKSALAWALYHDPGVDAAQKFDCKAFVVASECIGEAIPNKAAELLRKIVEQVTESNEETARKDKNSNVTQLAEKLKNFLLTKRYLVVVDDIKEIKLWEELKSAFPNEQTSGSRIIVTTSIQSVATSLSRGRYRYTMCGLNDEDSEKLFSREISGSELNDPIKPGSANYSRSILSKCDGSPLALVSAAKHLKPYPTVEHYCEMVGRALGTEVAGAEQENAFWELKRALIECYSSLPKYHHRRSLLSIVMSPQGHPINKNSLLRRWIAEGLVTIDDQYDKKDVACMSFHQFVDRSIIDPGLTGSNSKVRRYRVQGILLEFIVHKSTCATNFATLIHQNGRLPLQKDVNKRIRRLFVSDGAQTGFIEEIKKHLDFIRWLTICPTSTSIPFDLSKCKLLRVLDLEGSKGIDKEVMANICTLGKFLKYLSLRGSDVRLIPKEITQLVNLETLDIRETGELKLPMEVLLMPGLAHLFGKFELVGSYRILPSQKEKESQPNELVMGLLLVIGKKKKEKYSRWESNLETLSGVIVDNMENLTKILLHAKKLKKVKIWCKMSTMEYVLPVKRLTGSEVLDSLSIDSSNHPIDMLTDKFLEYSSGAWAIKSLKLRGFLQGLPVTSDSFMKLQLVLKLHLSLTGRSWKDLSVLQKMSGLSELKLEEDCRDIGDESFIVEKGGFPSLKQLCIEGPELPTVQLKEGATPSLVSLELMLTLGQNHAIVEITTAEPEASIQEEAMPDVTSAQPHVTTTLEMEPSLVNSHLLEAPLQMGATPEVTTQQKDQARVNIEVTTKNTKHATIGILQRGVKMRHRGTQVGQQGVPGDTTHQRERNALLHNTPDGLEKMSCESDNGDERLISIADVELRLGVVGLLPLKNLNEVILHHSTSDKTMQYWEEVSKRHRNKPYIKKSNRG